MSIEDINNNPNMLQIWINKEKVNAERYYSENPDSLIPLFERDLKKFGFIFEFIGQAVSFMPKHKKTILPIAIRYYQLAKKQQKYNEQDFFLKFFHFKGFDEVVPMLIDDYYSLITPDLTRWYISDCLFAIKSNQYIDEYLRMIANPELGQNRQMIILLVGKLKIEKAIPVLIDLLEDEDVRLHAICALGDFKKEELRCYFERFQNAKHPGWRKYAKAALKRLDS